jgi:hypothetical protein
MLPSNRGYDAVGPAPNELDSRSVRVDPCRSDDFFNLGARTVQASDLCGRQCRAIRVVALGAVSDDQGFQIPRQPTAPHPIGVTATGAERLTFWPTAGAIAALTSCGWTAADRRAPGRGSLTTRPLASTCASSPTTASPVRGRPCTCCLAAWALPGWSWTPIGSWTYALTGPLSGCCSCAARLRRKRH